MFGVKKKYVLLHKKHTSKMLFLRKNWNVHVSSQTGISHAIPKYIMSKCIKFKN